MANKNALLQVKITEKQKKQIEAAAKAQDVKVPAYVLEALDFYGSFDVHFLETIYSTAEKVKLSMPLTIQQLLSSYLAQDYAYTDAFGKPSKAYQRAFQYDENGLIEGNAHSDLVYNQTIEDIATLKEKLTCSAETGEPAQITAQEAVLIAARL